MSGKLKDLYVKRNQNQYQPAADSWEARAAELSNMSGGAMQQGETAGNGAFGWLKDSFDAGVAGVFGGTARLAGEFMPFGNDTLNSWADYFDDVARRNSPQPGQNLEGIDYVASAVGNALGSGAASALEAGAVAGLGSLLGAGGVAGTVLGGASKVIPGVGKAVQAGKTLWGSPVGKYLVANVAGSPFEAGSEAGNLISDMRKENQQGTANYTDDEIRDAALRSGALNLAWLTGMNMLEAGTLGKITGALGGKMAKDTYKGITGRALMGGTASGIGEGAEEYGQNLIGDYSKRGSTADFNYDEAMEAAKMGAIGGGVLGGLGSGLSAKFSKKNSDVAEEIASEDGGTIEEAPTEENFWENKEAAKHSIQQAYADGLISKDDARVMLMTLNGEELGEADKKRLKAREKQVAAAIESRRIQGYNDELDNYVNNYESSKEAFINAIGGQESGGDYGAVNGRTGASGKYQIMPENWPAWAEEAGIGADAEMTPENQEIVARYKLGEYYDKYGARGAAIAWYAGEGALDYSEEALNRKQGNGDEPSINEYADSVLARMGNVADNARIDDSEENYFNESDSMGLPKLSAPTAKGFDVSHLVDEEAQDARELFGKKQDENIGKQNLGNDFFSNIKVEQDKRAKAIKDIARAVSQPNTFDELRNSIPSNYLEQMQKARAVVPVNNNAVGRPIPSQTGTALTMQRGRNGGLNTDELAIMQKYQGNPDAFNRQFKKSVEAVRDAVNRGDITPDVGRAYMQNLGNMYNTVVGTVQNDGVILQGQEPAIIKMLGNLRDKRRRGDIGALPSLLQENGNADRSAAFANIINARAAQKFDEAETADQFKFVPQRQSMYDGAMRRNLAAQDKVKPEEQPIVEPTERNGAALDKRNMLDITLPKVKEQHKWDKEHKEYHAERYGESALPQTQLLSTDRAARRNMPKPGIEARSFINDRAEKKSARERMQDAIAFVWKDDPKHPLKACRRQLNMFRDMRKEYLQPIYDVMAEGAGNGVSRIPIIEFDNQHRGRFYRQSNNSPWYAKYFKEHKKKPTQKAMYDIAEEVAFGENADVGYYAGVQGKELEAIVEENHAQLDPINDYIQTYESLELRLKENPNYGKEQAERINKAEEERRAEKRNAGETASAESNEAEEKQPAESNQDEVNKKAPALAEGYTTESGRSLDEADENEFVLHKGEKNFGEINKEVSAASGGELSRGYIRLKVGNASKGLIHAKKHESQAIKAGYNSIEDMIYDVCQNFTDIYKQEPKIKGYRPTYILVKRDSKGTLNATSPVYFELQADGNGGYYVVITAIPKSEKSLQRQTKKETLLYSRPGIDSAATSNSSAVSHQGNNNVGVAQGVLPTSDTASVSVTQSVAQPAENVKKLNLPKGTTADVSIVGDNSNIIQVKFNGEQGKGTGGILGRAGYVWKKDKQVWQARKTDKAMDVAEQLGYKPAEEMSEDKSQQTDKYKNYSKEDIKINKERLATMPDVDGILQPAAKKFAEFFKAHFPKSDYTYETVDFWNNYILEFEQLNKILKKYRQATQQGNLSEADAYFQQISSSLDRLNNLLGKLVGKDKEEQQAQMRQEFRDSIIPFFDEYNKIVDKHNAKEDAKKASKAKKQQNQGKQEYKYYLNARPADIGAVPKGFIRVDTEDKGGRYGAIYYDRQLNDTDVQQYELKSADDVEKEKAQKEALETVSKELLQSDKLLAKAGIETLDRDTLMKRSRDNANSSKEKQTPKKFMSFEAIDGNGKRVFAAGAISTRKDRDGRTLPENEVDEDTYQLAKEYGGYKDGRVVGVAFKDKEARDKFVEDMNQRATNTAENVVESNKDNTNEGGNNNGIDVTGKLSSNDTGSRRAENEIRTTSSSEESSGSNGQGSRTLEGQSGRNGNNGVPGSRTAVGGKTSTSKGSEQVSAVRENPARSAELSGSVVDSLQEQPNVDEGPTDKIVESVADGRTDAADTVSQKVNEVVKENNLDRQRADRLRKTAKVMPFLSKIQFSNTDFVADRLADNGKQGVMITDGTGTGKTFSGLAVAKEMVEDGKENILIVTPSDSVNNQWANAAKDFFGIELSKLDNIQDAGKGAVITTYANLGANDALIKRDWDLVICDESHYLMNNEQGEKTAALAKLRQLTLHPRELRARAEERILPEEKLEARRTIAQAAKLKRKKGQLKASEEAIVEKAEKLQKEKADELSKEERVQVEAQIKDWEQLNTTEKPKVMFMSATPFAYVPDIDYAEGYLFDYPKVEGGSYNQPGNGFQQFMIEHFGYHMRYNKLTKPDKAVDNAVMEVEFHEWLRKTGALTGHELEIDKDYNRGFLLVDQGVGKKIDEGFEFLRNNHDKYRELEGVLNKQFDSRRRNYLLESIKARESVPIIQQYLKAGKKVVVFYETNVERESFNPFKFTQQTKELLQSGENRWTSEEIQHEMDMFAKERPDLVNLNLDELSEPISIYREAFGDDAMFFNGRVSKNKRAEYVKAFNDDNSGKNLIFVQQDAGNAGISLHDTTGKHQRVLINIGIPRRPSYAIQIEGRIYRLGNKSNAIIRYLTTATNIENGLFAETVAGRASTAENLALGRRARGLRDSFKNAYQEIFDGTWEDRSPGIEGEDVGGKENDRNIVSTDSDYDRAKAFYFARGKKTAKNKAAEGVDYFATPEPVGYKMVQWANVNAGDKILEPSAGHGAISRFFSPNTDNTIIEPSSRLAPQAQMNTDNAKLINGYFEDLHIGNKYDAVTMNPPFGTGGKTAVEHVAKAFKHLRNGGRVIAIIPRGAMADKRFDAWYESDDAKDAHMVGEVLLPGVTFERAGTKVATRIVIIDKGGESQGVKRIDLSRINDINELFDNLESVEMPARQTKQTDVGAANIANSLRKGDTEGNSEVVTADSYKHTKTGAIIPSAKLNANLSDEEYRKVKSIAGKNGGYYSRYAKAFLFQDNENGRDKFVEEVNGANNTQYSVSSEAVQRAKEEVEAEIRAAFPNGRVEYVNGVPTITMPNGSKFQYSIRENIVVNAKEQRKADAAHGTSGARVQGFWKKFTGNGVQRMLAVSQNSERGTAFHEAMHAAIDLVLTEKEKNALYNYYEKKAKEQKRDVDEVIADAYRDWVLARQRKSGTMFGKLWRKVKDFCTRIKALFDKGAEVERIMQDVESGRVYERGTNNHSVTKRISFSKEEIQGQKGSGTTQVATTRTMYVKALKWLRNQSPEAKTVLDYGAGLGLGTDDMRSNNPDLNIDCYEPNPERWAGKQPPTYTNNTQINKDYDLILNTNVLNVVEKPIRDLIVKDIADHLTMGGKALITTRGWNGDVNAAKNFKPADEEHAIWINKGKNGFVFQKGFDGDELKNYVAELLGDGYIVEKTRPTFGKSSVTITRVKAKVNTSAQNIYSGTESINPNEEYIQGLNDTDADKVNAIAKSFEDKGYVGRPIVVIENGNEGYIALTGSHRIEAAKQADVDLKAIVLENNEDTAQLIDVRDDDERADIAKQLYEEGVISKSAYDVIREEADNNYTHYSVASPKHKIANAFTNTERKGVVDSAKDFFKEHRKSLYQDWFDKNNPLKGFDALTKATGGLSVYDQVQSLPATTAGMLKALTEGTAQHVKMANQHLKNVKMKYNVTLAMALEKIDKKQMDKAYPKYLAENGFDNWVNALGAYLGAERCLEMAQLARAEGKTYKFPKGLTEQECQEFVKKAPQQFKAAADIFYKVNDNVISIMEDAEVFSHDLAKTLRTKYRKYCPLLRDFSDTAAADSFIGGLTEGGRGIGNVSVPLKRINIEGSERGVLNPLETILKSYAVMLNRAERNKVALMAVENSRTADLHELIQEVPGTTADPKNCVFTVLINGKKKAYKTTQDLYGPIVGYNLPAANLAFGVARTAARMLRTGATMSPSFILRNVLRDTVFAGVSSKNGFIPIVDTIRGAIALAKDPAMRAEFEAAGVTEYNFYSSQKSRIKSLDAMAGETPASAWEIMKAVFSRLEATSDFFESSTRMGEYMKARKKGLSMEEAARAAREVTLDFSRSGRIGEQVNQVVPFFNACLQGGDKMVRLFRENPWGTAMKVTGYIILPSLLLLAMNWDEDWYKDLDPDIKNNYWCLGRNIRIPKPQEAGVLFGSGIEALFQQAADKDKDAVSNFLKAFSSNMMPSVLPTLILPLIEWSANYSFFKGRALVGNKYSRLPDELQYNDYTSELSKGIGSTLKVSPMKIDNLVRGYTGTMGALLWSMAGEPFAKANNLPAKHFSELPFVRDFNVTDANLSRPMNEFYGILDKANRQHAGYGVKGKPEAAVKGIRSAGSMISKIRKDIDKITHSNLTPERKRELIDKRKEKMNQIAKQATARYGKYFE